MKDYYEQLSTKKLGHLEVNVTLYLLEGLYSKRQKITSVGEDMEKLYPVIGI